ncbi:MAG: GNAT family N-acetyltransferase [Candidatus Saccharimonadaceae bacterium]|jgi:phosphinothricin acetyltransferase|nr:GNAT family N-acetyltransferase [Candidatus Saccharimonadaceae bacterium]
MGYQIRKMVYTDWLEVSRIYQEGMDTNLATFQSDCPSWEEWNASHLKDCRLVIMNDGTILGWAALTAVSGRCVYAGVAEVSIYIDQNFRGRGAGKVLLLELIRCSEEHGLWTLQSGIMQENKASICLHESCGFRLVGYRERIGRDRFGNWRNTVLMERRCTSDLFNGTCPCDSGNV